MQQVKIVLHFKKYSIEIFQSNNMPLYLLKSSSSLFLLKTLYLVQKKMKAFINFHLYFNKLITTFSYSWLPNLLKIIMLSTFAFLNSYRQRQLERNSFKENIDEKSSKFVYTRIRYLTRDEEPLECVICLSKFKYGDKGRKLDNCNHIFHESCLKKWLMHGKGQSTCPLCRNVVISENVFEKQMKIEDEGSRYNAFEEELAFLLLSTLKGSRCCQ